MDLIHPRTRNAFREACSDFGVIRTVSDAFAVEGLEPANEDEHLEHGGGMRRSLFDEYTKYIDWSDPVEVRKVLNAFETVLSWTVDGATAYLKQSRGNLIRLLARDGYVVDEMGRITGGPTPVVGDLGLEHLRDPTAVLEHLNRLERANDMTPGELISAAKALIESTCKIVLSELNIVYDDRNDDVPKLVHKVQNGLIARDGAIAPTGRGVQTTKRILSNLSQLAVGVAELRNEYGVDHGRASATTGLEGRHASLALGSATAFCRFVIETLGALRTSDEFRLATE